MRYNTGPKTDPSGTPTKRTRLNMIHRFWHTGYGCKDKIHQLYRCWSFERNKLWFNLSKATDRSNKINNTFFHLFKASRISLWTPSNEVSVPWKTLYADCKVTWRSLLDKVLLYFFSFIDLNLFLKKWYKRKRKKKEWERPWIIERPDRKLADAIGSNIVEKCDVTLSRAIQPFTSDVTCMRVLFSSHISLSLSSTMRIAHVLK